MKFGQLIECNMRNNFLEKSYSKCEKLFPDTSLKKLKLTISLDQLSIVLNSLLLLYAKLWAIETY